MEGHDRLVIVYTDDNWPAEVEPTYCPDGADRTLIRRMPSSHPSLLAIVCLVLLLAFGTGRQAPATEQFPSTFICQKKDGTWECHNGYVGGWWIYVESPDGQKLLRLSVTKEALPAADVEKYVSKTTAGPRWAEFALPYFLALDGKQHVCIRTWWDRRILIDLQAARQVSERGREDTLLAAERKHVLEALQAGVARLKKPKDRRNADGDDFWTLLASVHVAGRMKLKDAVPFLKRLEASDATTSYSGGLATPLDRGLDPTSHYVFEPRRLAQLSLRRLGEAPAGYPSTQLSYDSPEADTNSDAPKLARPRVERVGEVKTGMKPLDAFRALGQPDYVERGFPWKDYVWRYDIDANPPYTLLLIWEGLNLTAFEKIEPALWNGNDLFGPQVKNAVFDADGSIIRAAPLYAKKSPYKVTRR